MEAVTRAVIDVGTNSIKLLVAEVAGRVVTPLLEQSKQTRLGSGFYETHRLQAPAIAASAEAVARFAVLAREQNATKIRVVATSAARDAVNATELTQAIEMASGLPVEIISGAQEADWVFRGATTDGSLVDVPILLLDVGGGSTEFILGQGERKDFCTSLPLGSVRLMETFPPNDPPAREQLEACRDWVRTFLDRELASQLQAIIQKQPGTQVVGTGGTTSILGRMEAQLEDYDRVRIETTRIRIDRMRWHVNHLWSLPLEQRKQIIGLPKNRADVILFGSLIYEMVMELFGFSELRISTRGLRFAVVLEG